MDAAREWSGCKGALAAICGGCPVGVVGGGANDDQRMLVGANCADWKVVVVAKHGNVAAGGTVLGVMSIWAAGMIVGACGCALVGGCRYAGALCTLWGGAAEATMPATGIMWHA
jgi:hypothetical protein